MRFISSNFLFFLPPLTLGSSPSSGTPAPITLETTAGLLGAAPLGPFQSGASPGRLLAFQSPLTPPGLALSQAGLAPLPSVPVRFDVAVMSLRRSVSCVSVSPVTLRYSSSDILSRWSGVKEPIRALASGQPVPWHASYACRRSIVVGGGRDPAGRATVFESKRAFIASGVNLLLRSTLSRMGGPFLSRRECTGGGAGRGPSGYGKIGRRFLSSNLGGAVGGHLLSSSVSLRPHHASPESSSVTGARTRHLVEVGQLLETAKLQARAERRPQQQLH